MENLINNKRIVLTCLLFIISMASWGQETDAVDVPEDQVETGEPAFSVDTVIVSASPEGSVALQGNVTDASAGTALGGIRLEVPGFSSAISDPEGNFTLYVPSYKATLVVSGDGYHDKEIALKGRQHVTVALHEAKYNSIYRTAHALNAKKPLAHSVNALVSVGTRDKFQSSSETPENFLQGKVPGLNMTRRSGTPGMGTFMNLRGFNSLYATNQPLVVIDGMIYDMNDYGSSIVKNHFVNPLAYVDIKDIDNITVVKDAASHFGSKGANGAIFITTSRAEELATQIDFSVYTGINFTPKNIPVMGPENYRLYVADMLKSAGYDDAFIQSRPFMIDDPSYPGYYVYHNNTDWQRKVFANSVNQNYAIRITGGDNIARYALSVGYADHKGIVEETWMKRYHMRFNADLNISPKVSGTANLSFTYAENKLIEEGLADKTNPVFLSLVKAPLLHTNEISEEGLISPNLAGIDIFTVSNPSRILANMVGADKNYRFFGSVNFNYKITDGLAASTLFGLTTDKIRESLFIPKEGVIPDTLYNALALNRMGAQLQRMFMAYSDTRVSYDKTFSNRHTLSSKLGFRMINNVSEQDYGLGFNSATDDLITIGTGVNALRQVGGNLGRWTWLNHYAAVDYNFMRKYFLSFNVAIDGSSRFGKEAEEGIKLYRHSFGVFPSVGAAWLMSSENFMANVDFIDLMKLRINYGLSGNDDIGNYNGREYYTSQNLLGMQGLVRGTMANPALQWETVTKLNAGLDLSFMNERLLISIDAFRNNTDNMLTYQETESVTGFEYVLVNGGAMQNQGLELGLQSRVLDRSVKVDLALNLAAYRNELTRLPGYEMETHYAGGTVLSRVGQPLGVFYGHRTRGVYATDEAASAEGLRSIDATGTTRYFRGGDVQFTDVNNDQIIDLKDRQVIGDPNPDFTGMFSGRLAYKRFTVDAALTFSYGNEVYNYTRAQLESMSGYYNQTERVGNRWRTNGQQTNMPRAEWGDPMGNARFSDRWIEDGSYVRLRTLSLAYDLPLKNNYIKSSTVFFTASNLFTLTRYLGYDPEFSASNNALLQGMDTGMVPQFKSLLLGVRVGL